jgi:hypothetical protein
MASDPGKAHELFIKASVIYQMDPALNLYDPLILASYLKLIPRPERDVTAVRAFLDAAFMKLMRLRERTLASEQGGGLVTTQVFSALNDLLPLYRFYWPEKASEVVAFTQQLRRCRPCPRRGTERRYPAIRPPLTRRIPDVERQARRSLQGCRED